MTNEQGPKLTVRRLRPFPRIGLAVLIVLAMAGGLAWFIHWRANSFRARAQSIKVGDSNEQVEKLLGRPTCIFLRDPIDPAGVTNFGTFILSVHSETWAYGSSLAKRPFQPEFPYFFPFRWRTGSPFTDDVVIVFSSREKVSKVVIPDPPR